MTRIRIICLSHPRNWIKIKEKNNIKESILNINQNSTSWLSSKGNLGNRYGIYRKPFLLLDNRFLLIHVVWEKIVNSSSLDIDNLLNMVENNGKKSQPGAVAIQSELILDIEDGVCYLIDNGIYTMAPEKFDEMFTKIIQDTKLPLSDIKPFFWDKETLRKFTDIARKYHFKPYKERGRTNASNISAKGDLDNDYQLKNFESNVGNGRWTTYAYLNDDSDNRFTFSLIGNFISISNNDENKDRKVLLSRISEIRSLFERTIGSTIPERCFLDYR